MRPGYTVPPTIRPSGYQALSSNLKLFFVGGHDNIHFYGQQSAGIFLEILTAWLLTTKFTLPFPSQSEIAIIL